MSHHSQHYFIIQYISLRGTAVNEFYRMIRMLEATEQRPMNNEYVNIMNLQTVTRDLGCHFKTSQQIFSTLQTRNHEVNRQML